MAVKYVKDFEFPSDKGFTGSAGAQHVKGYARGGSVKKAMGGDVTATVDPAMPVKGSAANPQVQMNEVSTDGRDGRRFGPAAAGGSGALPRAVQLQRANAANVVAPRKAVPAYNKQPLVQRAAHGGPAKPVKKSMGGLMGAIPAALSKDNAGIGALGLLGLLASASRKKKAAPAATDLAAAPASAAAALAANQQANPPVSGMAKGGKAKMKC
jgi:hypothetical protein